MEIEPVVVTVVVRKSKSEAFAAFTEKVAAWWPLKTHSIGPYLGEAVPDTVIVEGFEGGRIFEVSPDGQQRAWGIVTEWTPVEAVAFTWHPGHEAEKATHVRVEFSAADAGGTLVTLTHTGWQALGDTAQSARDNYASGWEGILQGEFADYAEAGVVAR